MSELVVKYGNILNDKKERLSVRFRALFSLKNLGGSDAIDQIGKCSGIAGWSTIGGIAITQHTPLRWQWGTTVCHA